MNVEATFALDSVPTEVVARTLVAVVRDPVTPAPVLVDGRIVSLEKVWSDARIRRHFRIEVETWKLEWGEVRNCDHALLTLAEMPIAVAENLVIELAHRAPLIMARAYDVEFDRWQNAEDPREFESVGRPLEGVRMRSNGLPPPLGQMVVDTSANPGRRVFRDRYVEAVGHRMWLGPEFFRRVPGSDRASVRADPSIDVRVLDDDILEVVALADPFVDETTRETQVRLRRLLYSQT